MTAVPNARPKFLCPHCGADDRDEPMFRSVQRTTVEYEIRTNVEDPGDFDYTGESNTDDEGARHEYFRCLDCEHFFIIAAPAGAFGLEPRSRTEVEFAMLLAFSGNLRDWPQEVDLAPEAIQLRADIQQEFWDSSDASERECRKALRKERRRERANQGRNQFIASWTLPKRGVMEVPVNARDADSAYELAADSLEPWEQGIKEAMDGNIEIRPLTRADDQ